MKRLIVFFSFVILFLAVASVLVFYGRGYRINFDEKKIAGTGILSISSIPSGAEVYLNGEKRGDTDADIANLEPGKYKLRLVKEGFSEWNKEIEIIKEMVTPAEALLLPSAPSLSPLTYSGIISPKLSPDSQKIAYGVSEKDKAGIWVMELAGRQLIFSRDPIQIAKDSKDFTVSSSEFIWSSDGNSLLVSGKDKTGKQKNFLLDAGRLNESFEDTSSKEATKLKEDWAKDEEEKEKERLIELGKEAEKAAKAADKLLFSPDGQRVLILKKGEKPLVYDSNPTLTPGAKPAKFTVPSAQDYIWFPTTSRHLILVKEGSIGVVEADGENNVTVYTGNFDKDVVFPWPDGSKLVIATTLNTTTSKNPNLYTIDLR